MGLNAEGLWIYDELEDAAPVSTMLNRLADSVTDVVTPLIGDTGWVALTLLAGFGGTLFARRRASNVFIRGLVTPNVSWGGGLTDNQICNTVPVQFRPVAAHVEICASQSPSDATYFRVASATSIISVRSPTGGGYTPGVYINYDYMAD